MFKLKKIFDQKFLSSIYRNYVSIININADIVKSIKLIPDEYENSYQESEIRVEAIDGDKNLLKINDSNAKVTKTKDEFNFDWLDKKDDTSLIFEIPMSFCRDLEITVNVKRKGHVKIDNIPSTKFVEVFTKLGRIKMCQIRSEKVTAQSNEVYLESVYSTVIDLKGLKEDEGNVMLQGCQAQWIRAVAEKISMDSCYTSNVNVKSTHSCLLKTLQGNLKAEAIGEVFNTVAFSGTMNADIKCKSAMLHFSELVDDNCIKINHPEAFVRAGFANEIVKETTDLHILSNCPIQTKSKEFVVCHKAENEYEILRKNPESDSSLKMDILNAKEVHIIKQSWIDSLSFG